MTVGQVAGGGNILQRRFTMVEQVVVVHRDQVADDVCIRARWHEIERTAGGEFSLVQGDLIRSRLPFEHERGESADRVGGLRIRPIAGDDVAEIAVQHKEHGEGFRVSRVVDITKVEFRQIAHVSNALALQRCIRFPAIVPASIGFEASWNAVDAWLSVSNSRTVMVTTRVPGEGEGVLIAMAGVVKLNWSAEMYFLA